MNRKLLLLVGAPLAAVVAVVGGTFVYINVVKDEAPTRLTLSDDPTTTTPIAAGETATSAAGSPTSSAPTASTTSPDGAWKATPESVAGYRVKEVLFGQDTEGVGRTNSVTGSITVSGRSVSNVTFTVDMTTIKSDSSQRDGQFHGRIMETSQFPKATFTASGPITLPSAPESGKVVSAKASGTLDLHGVKKAIAFDVQAKWSGTKIEVNANKIPIVFDDFSIDNPSGGPASVGDTGELELTLVLERG